MCIPGDAQVLVPFKGKLIPSVQFHMRKQNSSYCLGQGRAMISLRERIQHLQLMERS